MEGGGASLSMQPMDYSKLHYIKPRIEEWGSAHNSCRQYEFKLSRIHIGYTRLTNPQTFDVEEYPTTNMWKP